MPATTEYQSFWDAFRVPLTNTAQRVVAFVPRLLVALVLFAVFYGIAVLSRRLVRRSLAPLTHIPWAVRVLISRTVYLAILVVGLLVALAAANINVATLVASLGVAGFALGFALKDILENFIAGILLLFARPFEVGDQVTLEEYEGTVRDIQIRTTTLEMYDGEMVAIPNSSVYTNPVVNHTRLGRRRYQVDFDTSLTADMATVERAALRAAEDVTTDRDPPPSVQLIGMDSGNDVLSWRVYYWAEPEKAVEVKTVSETLRRIKQSLFDAGVPTPTATSATIFRGGSGTAADVPSGGRSAARPDARSGTPTGGMTR